MSGPGPMASSFPNGFANGIKIRNVPLLQAQPGQAFFLYNGTALQRGQVAGSDGNPGTFNRPFSTLQGAINACTASKGDIIIVLPGHAEAVSSATALAFNKAGIAIIGLGVGTQRPTFTLNTANTATIAVSAANICVQNCIFVANFLSIAALFTLTTAKAFVVENCEIRDTSNVLNFLAVVKSTGAANTIDGLTFNDNVVALAGTTSVTSCVVSANDVDRLVMQRNYIKMGVTNDKAIALTVTTGVLTNLIFTDNMMYRLNTTTAGGGSINVGGTTSTGIVANNFQQTATTTTDLLFTTSVGLGAVGNSVSGAVGAQGFPIPALDS